MRDMISVLLGSPESSRSDRRIVIVFNERLSRILFERHVWHKQLLSPGAADIQSIELARADLRWSSGPVLESDFDPKLTLAVRVSSLQMLERRRVKRRTGSI